MKDRINQIKLKEGMTDGQFAEKIGISPASLSHILNGRNKPSLEVVTKIHKACSYVDLEWLLYGTGEMVNTHDASQQGENGTSLFDEKKMIMTG